LAQFEIDGLDVFRFPGRRGYKAVIKSEQAYVLAKREGANFLELFGMSRST
jgi:hypothetical protein